MNCKNIIFKLMAVVVLLTSAPTFIQAQRNLPVRKAVMIRNGDTMSTLLELDLRYFKVGTNDAVQFTPLIVNGRDTLPLYGAVIYGRTRGVIWERQGGIPFSHSNDKVYKASEMPRTLVFQDNVNYQDWMDGSKLVLKRTDYGCAGCQKTINPNRELAYYNEPVEYVEPEYVPEFKFMAAVAEATKTRELSGRAFIDFPVNKTVIYPDYRRNPIELQKIIATIDSIKNDKDITVKFLHISGTASPEGSYDNNVRLAKGRTEALKNYVQGLYNFPRGFITTSYTPVDWDGLRAWLETHPIENGEYILNIVNGSVEAYQKNQNIKNNYPTQYQYLLKNVYPALRHSDYRIEYEIRQFTDIEEIAEMMRIAPQKLSLNEMYILANSYTPGSDEYNKVYETAVRIYPEDPVANLNAANAAMMRGDLFLAEKYLQKAGDSLEAEYARNVLEKLKANN